MRFYGILLELKRLSFLTFYPSQICWRSTEWSTGPEVGRLDWSTDVHEDMHMASLEG